MSDADQSDGETVLPTLRDLQRWHNKDLSAWLSKRGLPKSGVKAVLAKRVYRAMNEGESDITDIDSDSEYEEYDTRVDDNEWAPATIENLPPVEPKDITNYFLFRKSHLGTRRNCNRQMLKAKRFSAERFIGKVEVNLCHEVVVVRASCRPSMKQTVELGQGRVAKCYSLNIVVVKDSGRVVKGYCNCKAGATGLCSHVGGTLYTLLSIREACTSAACSWTQPPVLAGQMTAQRVCDIRIHKPEKNNAPVQKAYPGVFQTDRCENRDSCASDFLSDLLDGLKTACPESRLYRTLRCEKSDISDILAAFDTTFSYHDSVDLRDASCQQKFMSHMPSFDEDSADRLEAGTVGQANNKNWSLARKSLLTSSLFGGKPCKYYYIYNQY